MTSANAASITDVTADPWEAAYLRFETPDEEERKFVRRLVSAGAASWPRDSQILDLFCGRGGGIRALRYLGFRNVLGVDLSPRLLRAQPDSWNRCVADCRCLPVATHSADIAVVQGGLHHLPTIPDDLCLLLAEVVRTLRPGGLFVAVEPWRTPFLTAVHWICGIRPLRRLIPRIDALATMIEYERTTYEAWLASGATVLERLDHHFERRQLHIRLGKVHYVGRRAP